MGNFRDQEMVGGEKNFTDKYVVQIVQHPARTGHLTLLLIRLSVTCLPPNRSRFILGENLKKDY